MSHSISRAQLRSFQLLVAVYRKSEYLRMKAVLSGVIAFALLAALTTTAAGHRTAIGVITVLAVLAVLTHYDGASVDVRAVRRAARDLEAR